VVSQAGIKAQAEIARGADRSSVPPVTGTSFYRFP
jgi:hypothetical protein